MSEFPTRVAHVFPYDPAHLGQDVRTWAGAQLERWPLAAVRRSRLAARTTVHVIARRILRVRADGLQIVAQPSLTSGPRFRDWGDDWSWGLEFALRTLGPRDACVIHLDDYPSARLVHRVASPARVVVVFHGRGVGRYDDHLARAALLVVLSERSAAELRAAGAPPERIAVLSPSVDLGCFRPPDAGAQLPDRPVLGFVGRIERSKGVLDIPAVLAEQPDVVVELAGPAPAEQRGEFERACAEAGVGARVDLLGELPPSEVARRMRERWVALLVPSYTEGHPLVVLEACASGLPVAAVAGVLPPELERRPGIATCPRESYPALVESLLECRERLPAADWVVSHEEAAADWDRLLEGLPSGCESRPAAPSRIRRFRRLRPLRRAGRVVLGREA